MVYLFVSLDFYVAVNISFSVVPEKIFLDWINVTC